MQDPKNDSEEGACLKHNDQRWLSTSDDDCELFALKGHLEWMTVGRLRLKKRTRRRESWWLSSCGCIFHLLPSADDSTNRALDFCSPFHDRPAMQELFERRVGGPTSSTAKKRSSIGSGF